MKSILQLFLCLLAVSMFGCSASIRTHYDPNEGHYEYITAHPLKKNEAFDKALSWIAVNYNSANTVIQLKNQESGDIVVKADGPFPIMGMTRYVHYTMQIKIKDEKSKFVFDLAGLAGGNGNTEQPTYAPPKDAMPSIEKYFENTRDQIVAEWKKPASSDF